MKKALLTIGIILVAFTVMAPAPEKAEKLKVDQNDWDYDPATNTLIVPLLCKFGIATAGEHADFKVSVFVTITNLDGNPQDPLVIEASGTDDIVKVDDSHWDYVKIEPAMLDTVSWNGDDDGSGEYVATGDVSLIGPSGNVLSTTTVMNLPIFALDGEFEPPPGCPTGEFCPAQ